MDVIRPNSQRLKHPPGMDANVENRLPYDLAAGAVQEKRLLEHRTLCLGAQSRVLSTNGRL
jgi:hypothetical protein